MNERKHRGDRSPQRRPAEGVRIIRADEAQAALDAGEATGRRPDDELRFGDVPPPRRDPGPRTGFPCPIRSTRRAPCRCRPSPRRGVVRTAAPMRTPESAASNPKPRYGVVNLPPRPPRRRRRDEMGDRGADR